MAIAASTILQSLSRPSHLQGNIDAWQADAKNYVAAAEQAWSSTEPYWGIWKVSNETVEVLPANLAGKKCIELGCGTGYVSAWMTRRGGDVTAIDPTPNQLETAKRLQKKHGLDFTLSEGFAEQLTFESDTFDFAVSEYGASLWADPYLWIPEAARILKRGGVLVFLTTSPMAVMCMPELDADGPTGTELLRPYFDLYKVQWPDSPGATEFNLPHGQLIDLLVTSGFSIEKLQELKAPAGVQTPYPWASSEWASQWPSEEVWFVRKK